MYKMNKKFVIKEGLDFGFMQAEGLLLVRCSVDAIVVRLKQSSGFAKRESRNKQTENRTI
jgi:hypothetical protein